MSTEGRRYRLVVRIFGCDPSDPGSTPGIATMLFEIELMTDGRRYNDEAEENNIVFLFIAREY